MKHNLLLAAGMALGIALALVGSVDLAGGQRLAGDDIAMVAGESIKLAKYKMAIESANSERRSPLTKAQREHVLSRMVDEALLIRYGIDLGLVQNDQSVRSPLVQAVMGFVTAKAESADISESDLRAFYEEEKALFARGARVSPALLYFDVRHGESLEATLERADRAVASLNSGQSLNEARQAFADDRMSLLPNALLPIGKLRDYVGRSLSEAAASLAQGESSEPVPTSNGFAVVFMQQRENGELPAFESIQANLRQAYRRRLGETGLRELLDELRDTYEVVLADPVIAE